MLNLRIFEGDYFLRYLLKEDRQGPVEDREEQTRRCEEIPTGVRIQLLVLQEG